MARIAGVDLPREKRVEIGLTYIYGIGLTTSQKMLAEVGINPDTRVKDLSENDISKLRDYIEHHLKVEGDLRREHQASGGNRLLSRCASSPWSARSRSEHQAERAYPQGPEEDHRWQEEGHQVIQWNYAVRAVS